MIGIVHPKHARSKHRWFEAVALKCKWISDLSYYLDSRRTGSGRQPWLHLTRIYLKIVDWSRSAINVV